MMSKFLRIFAVIVLMGVLVGSFTPVAAAAPRATLPEYFTLNLTVTPAAIRIGERVKFVVTVNYGADIPADQTYNVVIAFSSSNSGMFLNVQPDVATTLDPTKFDAKTLTWKGPLGPKGNQTVAGVIAFTAQIGRPTSVGTMPILIQNFVTLSQDTANPVFMSATANADIMVPPNYVVLLPIVNGILP
jgi:hypothetical protein